MTDRALFRRFPTARSMPHVAIADLPTPVEPLTNLGEALGVELWAKRDDISGTLYGGNKTRKLEFLLGDALEKGHEEVWTVGAIGSNHVLATSIWSRHIGLVPGALHYPQPMTDHVRHNLLALSTTDPNLTLTGTAAGLPFHLFKTKLKEWLNTNPEVYYVSGGGSSAVGVVGYVDAALELAEQIEVGEMPRPDRIYVAAGTCGTLAGLLLGFAYAGLDVRVIGVRVVDKVITNAPNVARLYNDGARYLSGFGVPEPPPLPYRDVELRNNFFGPGYGEPSGAGAAAMRLIDKYGGPHLEPTYTAKAFSAVVAEAAEAGEAGETILYWHTLSGVDLSDRIASGSVDLLPQEYAKFFEEEP